MTNAFFHRKRALIYEAKKAPCSRCGATHPPFVMDLHHVDGKHPRLAPSRNHPNLYRLKVAEIIEELKRCVVVCANCHRYIENEKEAVA